MFGGRIGLQCTEARLKYEAAEQLYSDQASFRLKGLPLAAEAFDRMLQIYRGHLPRSANLRAQTRPRPIATCPRSITPTQPQFPVPSVGRSLGWAVFRSRGVSRFRELPL